MVFFPFFICPTIEILSNESCEKAPCSYIIFFSIDRKIAIEYIPA